MQGGSPALMTHLSPALRQTLTYQSNVIKYADGQLIHSRGDIKPGLSIIKKGVANVGVYGVDGTFIMAGLLGAGECFGEFTIFTELPRTHDVSANGDVEIHQLEAGRFTKLCDEEPELLKAVLKTTLIRTHILLELLDSMRRLPLKERTVKLMLSLSYHSGRIAQIRTRQSDLADSLGVSRVSLGKVLKQLQTEEMIILGYRVITIPDREKMERWLEAKNNTPLIIKK